MLLLLVRLRPPQHLSGALEGKVDVAAKDGQEPGSAVVALASECEKGSGTTCVYPRDYCVDLGLSTSIRSEQINTRGHRIPQVRHSLQLHKPPFIFSVFLSPYKT